jgi:hypothetical protein
MPIRLWNSSHGKYSAKYKKIGIKGRHVASASKSGGETLRSSAFMAKGLLTKGVKLLKSTVFVGAPNKKRSEQGFQVVGGIPAMSRAGQEQRLKTGQPVSSTCTTSDTQRLANNAGHGIFQNVDIRHWLAIAIVG